MDTIAPPLPATPAGLRHRRVRLDLAAAAAACACGHVRASIAAWSVPVNPAVAVLLTSDLMINAVTNGAVETVMLGISWTSGRFRVEVHDASVSGDSWATAGADADAGRGLLLAAAMAADWGHYRTPAGRAVYFALVPGSPRPVLGAPPAILAAAGVARFPGDGPRIAPAGCRERGWCAVSPRRFTAPAVGAGGCRPADMRGTSFHGRGLSGAAWAGASCRGVYDRPLRCRLAFWSGITKRPPGRDERGPDTSGAGT